MAGAFKYVAPKLGSNVANKEQNLDYDMYGFAINEVW